MQRAAMAMLMMLACTTVGAGVTASAQDSPTVLELYTSQGCSSCPPADRLLGAKYADRRDVVALSFNVDYWDYLGWKDTLGKPAYSARQRAYATRRRDGEVYTPQIVVNGIAHAVGSMPKEIDRAIKASAKAAKKLKVPLVVTHEDGKLTVKLGAAPAAQPVQEATIWLASVRRRVTVPVLHGENRGRKLTYYNVVHGLAPVGMWKGEPTVIELRDEDVLQGRADTCAILVQLGKGGPIIAARWMDG